MRLLKFFTISIAAQHDILGNFEREGAPIKKRIPVEGAHTASGSSNVEGQRQPGRPLTR